ncbi:MAG TPA: hypothetical protein VLX12_02480, partial [Syntrophorhabdales bacterium]|nr:hypothetical protein [Syntrophorhabdales bacterium]
LMVPHLQVIPLRASLQLVADSAGGRARRRIGLRAAVRGIEEGRPLVLWMGHLPEHRFMP